MVRLVDGPSNQSLTKGDNLTTRKLASKRPKYCGRNIAKGLEAQIQIKPISSVAISITLKDPSTGSHDYPHHVHLKAKDSGSDK